MKKKSYLKGLLAALLMVTGSAYAQLYRCDGGGKITFSDSPCPSGAFQEKTEEAGDAKSSDTLVTSAPDYKQKAEAANKYLRIQAINREIDDKEREVQSNLDAMNVELEKRLKESKNIGVNKLNALYRQSLADEMQAIIAQYRVNNEVLHRQIELLRSEKSTLIQSLQAYVAETSTAQSNSRQNPSNAYKVDAQIRDKEREIQDNMNLMNQEVAKRQKESDDVNNPVLNALWKQSLSDEIKAIVAKHQAINDVLQTQLTELYAEKARLPKSN